MTARGFPAIPSPRMPSPGNGVTNTVYPGDKNAYFRGGYNTRVHTSCESGGPINGVQIETYYRGVRDQAGNRAKFGLALAEAMNLFFREYYGSELKRSARPLRSPKYSGN